MILRVPFAALCQHCASRASCATCVQAMDLSRSPAAPLLREAKGTEVLIFSKLGIVSGSATNPPILYSPFDPFCACCSLVDLVQASCCTSAPPFSPLKPKDNIMIGPWTEKTLARHWDIHKKQKVGKCHFVPQADHTEKKYEKQHVLQLGIATCIGSVLPTVFFASAKAHREVFPSFTQLAVNLWQTLVRLVYSTQDIGLGNISKLYHIIIYDMYILYLYIMLYIYHL